MKNTSLMVKCCKDCKIDMSSIPRDYPRCFDCNKKYQARKEEKVKAKIPVVNPSGKIQCKRCKKSVRDWTVNSTKDWHLRQYHKVCWAKERDYNNMMEYVNLCLSN